MARTVSTIQAQIQATLVTSFSNIGITIDPTKWSNRNMMNLFCFIFAACTAYVEQLMDTLKAEIEATASQNVPSTTSWIQTKMFQFQYSDSPTNPQVLTIVNGVPVYPVVDPTLQIITACSVSTVPNQVLIKLAKGNPFTNLDPALELPAAQTYINRLGTVGINYICISKKPDQLFINANIYYDGQYSSAYVSTNVQTAILAFLQNLATTNFNGLMKLSALENAITNTVGVNDVEFITVNARAADNASLNIQNNLVQGNLVNNSTELAPSYQPIAGYIVTETTVPYGLTNSLNYISQ